MIVINDLPADKSISHRALLFAALIGGKSKLIGEHFGADIHSTINCLQQFGVDITVENNYLLVESPGVQKFTQPQKSLDAGNSGTTARLLMGICSALPFTTTITGDASLCKRPMGRIAEPLQMMGANIQLSDAQYLPATIIGGDLRTIEYRLPVASAQLKSAILLAAFVANKAITIIEPIETRDHTERLLSAVGARVDKDGDSINFQPVGNYTFPEQLEIARDCSSAAYWLALGLVKPNCSMTLTGVNINPSRAGYVQVLQEAGAELRFENERIICNEPVVDIVASYSQLQAMHIKPAFVAKVIDELPILSFVALFADDTSVFEAVGELRVKESDRLLAMNELIAALGGRSTIVENDFHIYGNSRIHGGIIHTYNDHRIAMCALIAQLLVDDEVQIDDTSCIAISYPNFFDHYELIKREELPYELY